MDVDLSQYAKCLSNEVRKRYIEKISKFNFEDPYLLRKDGISFDCERYPNITYLITIKQKYLPMNLYTILYHQLEKITVMIFIFLDNIVPITNVHISLTTCVYILILKSRFTVSIMAAISSPTVIVTSAKTGYSTALSFHLRIDRELIIR